MSVLRDSLKQYQIHAMKEYQKSMEQARLDILKKEREKNPFSLQDNENLRPSYSNASQIVVFFFLPKRKFSPPKQLPSFLVMILPPFLPEIFW